MPRVLTRCERGAKITAQRLISQDKEEQMKKSIFAGICALLLVVAGVVFAAQPPPARNVSPGRHPHIAAAQQAAHRAFNQIVEAQRANEWDMDGHAQKAKDLLDQVNNELKRAAEAANANRH